MLLLSIKKQAGFTLIELLVALVIITVGAVSVLGVFPAGWSATGKADRIGQASEIMQRELNAAELSILNPCNAVAVGITNTTVFSGGQAAAQQGDRSYTVTRTIAAQPSNTWSVTVRVTWTGNTTGIAGSMLVGRGEDYRQPAGCPTV